MVINQAAAEQLFPGQNPIGKRARPYIDPEYDTTEKFVEIVGIVDNVKYGRLEEAAEPDVYLSALQPTDTTQTLIIRTNVESGAIASAVRNEVRALDKNIPLTAIQTMNERAKEVNSRTRFLAVLMAAFAGVALLLGGLGIYGVMAHNISAQTRELGIRIALGADAMSVIKLTIRSGLSLVTIGLGIGLIASFALTRLLRTLLFGVAPNDVTTIASVSFVLIVVALLACFIPARRATKVDPLVALRYE
jgi:ABC-type antimicrobial peptide transport system permease subunit